jgi:hypothetical protein
MIVVTDIEKREIQLRRLFCTHNEKLIINSLDVCIMDCYQDKANRRQPLFALNLDLGYFHWHILLGVIMDESPARTNHGEILGTISLVVRPTPILLVSRLLSIACTHGGMAGGMSNARPAGVRLVKEILSSPLPHERRSSHFSTAGAQPVNVTCQSTVHSTPGDATAVTHVRAEL